MSEPQHVYVTNFTLGGKSELGRVTVERSTPKLYYLVKDSQVDILGCMWLGNRISRSRCFNSELDALEYLRDKVVGYVRKCQQETAKAQASLASLEQMITGGE